MADLSLYLLAGLFVPVFPLSMVFNRLFAATRNTWRRSLLLLLWPQIGLLLIGAAEGDIPRWLLGLSLFTSAFYAFRAIALREVGQWTSFLATSLWALLWVSALHHTDSTLLVLHALGMSIPLGLLALLARYLEQRFGAAYTGLYGGLGETMPRFAGVLVFVVLAVTATPLFPGFFTMLSLVTETSHGIPLAAVALLGIWLLWSWAGIYLLQGMIVGPAGATTAKDLDVVTTWQYALALTALVVAGIVGIGGQL